MIIQQIQFLMRDKSGKTIVGVDSLIHNSHEDAVNFNDEKKLEYLRSKNLDVIRIVHPEENVIPVHFGED